MQFLGFILVIFGAIAVLNEFIPLMFWDRIYMFWPIIIVSYGIYRLFDKIKSKTTSALIIAIGVLLQLSKLPWFHGDMQNIFVGLLILALGVYLLIPNRKNYKNYNKKDSQSYEERRNPDGGSYKYNEKTGRYDKTDYYNEEETAYQNFKEDEYEKYKENRDRKNRDRRTQKEYSGSSKFVNLNVDMLHHNYLFSSEIININSTSFSGGLIDLKFSNITLDLRQAIPLDFEIPLDANLLFSTIKIMVPEDWEIVIKEKNQPYQNISPEDARHSLVINKSGVAGDIILI